MAARRRTPIEAVDRPPDFWDQASHDLRQPVQSLQLLAQVFARNADREPLRQAAQHMRRVVDDLVRMHEDLVRLSRLEGSGAPLARQAVAVVDLVQEISDELAGVARAHDATLRVHDLKGSVAADPGCLGLVLRGLLRLALQSCAGGEVTIRGGRRNGSFVLRIAFPGSGIPRDEAARVFVEGPAQGNGRAGPGPRYLRHLCRLLGYRLEMNAGKAGKQVFRLTIPPSSSPT